MLHKIRVAILILNLLLRRLRRYLISDGVIVIVNCLNLVDVLILDFELSLYSLPQRLCGLIIKLIIKSTINYRFIPKPLD